ncbi:MAG: PQQ-binding-like beta-propeller repeat protein [Myxococcota bacterium]
MSPAHPLPDRSRSHANGEPKRPRTGRAFPLGAQLAAALVLLAGAAGSSDRAFAETAGTPGAEAGSAYSPGGWSTLHQGPDNRKLVPSAPIQGPYRTWTALQGASILTAPTVSPDGRTLYVTTGQSVGHANLHAFSIDGEPLWQSEPWQDADRGVDPCAILSSPIVDVDGDVYIGDCNQLFAYHPSGALKWVVPLPPRRDGDWSPSKKLPINALTTAVFTREGDVLGVTNFGDVAVWDRATGRLINEPKRLPGLLPPPTGLKLARSAFGGGLLDPEIREWAWQLLMGGRMRSANTPAVDLQTGRVFVAATSKTPGKGALYALDVIHHRSLAGTGEWSDGESSDFEGPEVELRLAFSAEMGPGSGSSPALSIERHRVFVSDERGMLYSIDAKTGQDRGSIQTKAASAAAAVAANGDVIVLQSGPAALAAVTRKGAIRWESDLEELTRAQLPTSRMLGEPVALGNGNPTVVGGEVLVPVVYGYQTGSAKRRIPWPVRSFLVAVDAETGKGLRNVVELADDSTGITAVLPDGTILSSLGAGISSAVSPLAGLARMLLPGDLEPMPVVGGLQVSRPQPAP